MLEKIRRALLMMDIFGIPVSLTVKRHPTYNSAVGGTLSLFVLGILAYSLSEMLKNMYSRSQPKILTKVEYNPQPERYDFKAEDFFLYIGLLDKDGKAIVNTANEIYYIPNLRICQQHQLETGSTQNCSTFEMVRCSEADPDEKWKEVLSPQRLSQGYCPKMKNLTMQLNKVYLEGNGQTQNVSFISLHVSVCNNLTSFNKCASEDNLSRLKFGYSYISFGSNVYDETKVGNPYDRITKDAFDVFQINQVLSNTFYMAHSYFKTEENFYYMFPQIRNDHCLEYMEKQQSSGLLNVSSIYGVTFLQYRWFLASQSMTRYRTYPNVLDLMAKISGIFHLLMLIGRILTKAYVQKMLDISLLRDIFTIKRGKDDCKKIQLEDTPQTPLDRVKSYIQKHKSKNQPRFISVDTCTEGLGISQIRQTLDISCLMQKLIEVEQLKRILLNENQLRLFHMIPKPTIYLKTTDHQAQLIRQQANVLQNSQGNIYQGNDAQLLIDSFDVINSEQEHGVNRRLLQLMDKELLLLLQNSQGDPNLYSDPVNGQSALFYDLYQLDEPQPHMKPEQFA